MIKTVPRLCCYVAKTICHKLHVRVNIEEEEKAYRSTSYRTGTCGFDKQSRQYDEFLGANR